MFAFKVAVDKFLVEAQRVCHTADNDFCVTTDFVCCIQFEPALDIDTIFASIPTDPDVELSVNWDIESFNFRLIIRLGQAENTGEPWGNFSEMHFF